MAAVSKATKTLRKAPISKRTSQGINNRPKNKHARKNWKAYRQQGRP